MKSHENSALEQIRRAGNNSDPVAIWMQKVAAHALEPEKWPHPGDQPSPTAPTSNEQSLVDRLFDAQVASCSCLTKTPEHKYHGPMCRYRLFYEAWLALSNAPETSDEWQPIETAPKDGREVLIKVELRAGIPGRCLVGHYMGGGHCIQDHPPIDAGWYFWTGHIFDREAKPIAWMPLPADSPVKTAASTPAEVVPPSILAQAESLPGQ